MESGIIKGKQLAERLIEIGIALSAEKNQDLLLEKIVSFSRELTTADGGTLYLLYDDELHFKIMQTESLGIFRGGTPGTTDALRPVRLERSHVAAYAALEGKTVKIKDVYQSRLFDFSGPRKYDAVTGYRSKSMLVVPMKDHDDMVIGVLQLMNAKDPATGEVTVFPDNVVKVTEALASQAAVAIENLTLLTDVKNLFESLVRMLAVAIDAKTPCTTNHIQRVAELNLAIAEAIHKSDSGNFANTFFSPADFEEMRLAGWLHDVGKVTTPVNIINKAKKLESIFDRIDLVRLRFDLIKTLAEKKILEEKLHAVKKGIPPGGVDYDSRLQSTLDALDADLRFIEECNEPYEYMPDEKIQRLKKIAENRFTYQSEDHNFLTDDEIHNLTIRRGSLTKEEIEIMREHVVWTKRMLNEIPFKGKLKNVPLYAGQHHEKLNSSGYPDGLSRDEIPIQSRILAIADLYEALSAPDRPYKKKMSPEQIRDIMKRLVQNGDIDGDILEFCLNNRIFEQMEKNIGIEQRYDTQLE